MKYLNAKTVLPGPLVRELQRYTQGAYLYVPVDGTRPRRWGEVSGSRQELARRNRQITEAYRQGVSAEQLADTYCLSVSAIRKIIYRK